VGLTGITNALVTFHCVMNTILKPYLKNMY